MYEVAMCRSPKSKISEKLFAILILLPASQNSNPEHIHLFEINILMEHEGVAVILCCFEQKIFLFPFTKNFTLLFIYLPLIKKVLHSFRQKKLIKVNHRFIYIKVDFQLLFFRRNAKKFPAKSVADMWIKYSGNFFERIAKAIKKLNSLETFVETKNVRKMLEKTLWFC